MEIVTFILIHLVVPLLGVLGYLWLLLCMKSVERPPNLALFNIFATYGSWLVVLLTILFWYWSGMASLGGAYLIAVAPIVMIVFAVILYPDRRLSKYHLFSFIASAIYPILIAGLLGFMLLTEKPRR